MRNVKIETDSELASMKTKIALKMTRKKLKMTIKSYFDLKKRV